VRALHRHLRGSSARLAVAAPAGKEFGAIEETPRPGCVAITTPARTVRRASRQRKRGEWTTILSEAQG
jgi:hypothetical protein